MAEMCLTYLNSEQVKALPAHQSLGTLNMPFLKYCSLYWGVHAKRDFHIMEDHLRCSCFRNAMATYPSNIFWNN